MNLNFVARPSSARQAIMLTENERRVRLHSGKLHMEDREWNESKKRRIEAIRHTMATGTVDTELARKHQVTK